MRSTTPGTCSTISRSTRAHIVGRSQGAFATAHFGRQYAHASLTSRWRVEARARGREGHERFKKDAQATAQRIRERGMAEYAHGLTTNRTRSRFKQKDPRGFAEFVKHLSEHPNMGAANTMQEYQGKRPSLSTSRPNGRSSDVPTLIICGDEDEPCCSRVSILKRVLPNAGLACSPRPATR